MVSGVGGPSTGQPTAKGFNGEVTYRVGVTKRCDARHPPCLTSRPATPSGPFRILGCRFLGQKLHDADTPVEQKYDHATAGTGFESGRKCFLLKALIAASRPGTS